MKSFVERIEVGDSDVKVVYTIPMLPDSAPTEAVGVLPFIQNGSPSCTRPRTFTATFRLPWLSKKQTARPKLHRNPLVLAQQYQQRLSSGEIPSRAALARELGVSRAYVTQVLHLMDLAPQVKEIVLSQGDPLKRAIGVHTLLPITRLPSEKQEREIVKIIRKMRRPHVPKD